MLKAPSCLTTKQLRWIDEFLVDGNATAAAIRAGYSERSARSIAHENMTKPDVQAVLQARQAEVASELQITRQGVIQGLLEAVDMSREQRNPAAMVSALREMGKMLGFYAPETRRVEVAAGQGALQGHFSAMNDEQLLALMVQGTAAERPGL